MELKSRAARAALFVTITLIAYLPALRGGYVWDDDAHVTDNPTLTAPGGLAQIWLAPRALPQYYPLVHTTFWIEHHLWGVKPTGYHLVNVLLHALNALLLGWILERLAVRGAWLAAAIFALHPVHVESVAWITELKNVQSGLFYFLAGICFLRFYRLIPTPERSRGWYAAGCALYLCALLSKTVTATLPLALLVVLWWKRDRLTRRDAAPLAPLVAAGLAAGCVTLWIERHHVGTQGSEWALSLLEHGLLAGRVLWFYASKLVWPAKLSFFYSRWAIDPRAASQYRFALGVAAVVAALWAARARIGKGPLAAVLFFGVTLFPALGFFDVYPMRFSWVADHFQYLASSGLIALFCATLWAMVPAMAASRVAAAVLLALLGTLTWRQARTYKDAETLWRATIARTPDAWIAHNNLGVILMRRGDAQAAIGEYVETLRLEPNLPDTHLNLGNLLADSGQVDQAIEHYREAIRLDPENAAAFYNLGNTLLEAGRADEAIEQYNQALRVAPEHAEARINLGNALARRGRLAEAIAQYTEALRLNPDLAQAHNGFGVALAAQGRNAEAIEHYEQALRLAPDYGEAANNQGLALAAMDRWSEAIRPFQQALKIRPDYAEAHNNLGVALTRAHRGAEAAEEFRRALEIRPDFEDARANLRRVQEASGQHP